MTSSCLPSVGALDEDIFLSFHDLHDRTELPQQDRLPSTFVGWHYVRYAAVLHMPYVTSYATVAIYHDAFNHQGKVDLGKGVSVKGLRDSSQAKTDGMSQLIKIYAQGDCRSTMEYDFIGT